MGDIQDVLNFGNSDLTNYLKQIENLPKIVFNQELEAV